MIKRKLNWVDFSEPLGLYPWRIFKHGNELVVEVSGAGWRNVEFFSCHKNDITNWLNQIS